MNRLETIIDLSKKYKSVADIGCDHGQVGVELIKKYDLKKIINTDISDKCLKKAEDLFMLAGISQFYDGRVGSGLEPILNSEVDCIIIAGMGGDLIVDIIKNDLDKSRSFNNFIVQPMTSPDKVRKEFIKMGYGIKKDLCVIEDKKFYFIIEFSNDALEVSYSDYYYTETLMRDSKISYKLFLNSEIEKNKSIIKSIKSEGSELSLNKIDKLKEKILYLEDILNEN